MHNSNIPPHVELPSSQRLIKSTFIALAMACLLLVTTVLPAEYGVDPTGIGSVLGLTKMGEIKTSLAKEAEAATQAETLPTVEADSGITSVIEQTGQIVIPSQEKKDTITLKLQPNQAAEVKLAMSKNASTVYEWTADGPINFDTHGDPVPYKKGFYHGYGKGRAVKQDKGTIIAAFDGNHGWFWRNRTNRTVMLTLRTQGAYEDIKQVQ